MEYTLFQARSLPEAELLKQALESHEIRAWVVDQHLVAPYSAGPRVLILKKDFEASQKILNEFLRSTPREV